MRDIKTGEEITQDYGLLDNSNYELECTCGSSNCRKIVTGKDWKIKYLQDKYYDYFAQYLKEKIDKVNEPFNKSSGYPTFSEIIKYI